jgi:diacylglycerol kinase family enzyme
MMRAHLIMNPEARGVTPAVQRVVQAALEARFKLESTHTHARDAAIEVARAAVDDGAEVIIAFGGDGLVNEVVNGIVGTESILAIVPGGTMNVLARNLGLPKDPLEATDYILQKSEGLQKTGNAGTHKLSLGAANGRYFTFVCGCGFDAEAAAWVEDRKRSKRRFGEPIFYFSALTTFLTSYARRRPFLRVQTEGSSLDAVLAIGVKSGPYAYLAGRPLRLAPGQAADDKLQLLVVRKMSYWHLPIYAIGALLTGSYGGEATSATGIDEFTVKGEGPFAVHVDGEPLEPMSRLVVRAEAATLSVLV